MTARPLAIIRVGYGLLQLSAPNLVPARVLGAPLRGHEQVVVRLLGARHLLQAAITTALPTPSVLRYGAGVDAAHAASMMVAALDRRRRRTAVAETVCASVFTIAGVRAARRVDRPLSGRAATTT
ncbi:hypothetical protein R1CP_20080 [Rhodococcus opacus]|uniref:Uncharacterized protein n=1 Tax=Rhodococcus opacus TaxID=37919 RepID=A0A1B1K802_RHOOP|nr:hypothetical protein [Rhodococcus opacus]ANS28696.1 hypothetical protein R1CP_20080 [Rhodococcus opacus]